MNITTGMAYPEHKVGNSMRIARHHMNGFSLIELMVALVLSLVIMVAVVQIFTSSRNTYQIDEGYARVQENARFALDFLAKDIRMAGYLGCNSKLASSKIGNIVDPPSDAMGFSPEGIRGYRHTCASGCSGALSEWTPALPSGYFSAGEARVGTDVIIVERAADFGAHLTGNTVPSNANIQIISTASAASEIAGGDILIVSDCKAADIFRATNASSGSGKITIAHSNVGNTGNFLTNSYGNDAQLMKLVSRAYFIGTGTSGEPALMRKDLVNISGTAQLQSQELVEGVESMRAFYGQDTTATLAGTPERYVVPGTVTDWTKVVSMKLGFVVRTAGVADTALDTQSYDLIGDTSSALDNFDPVDDMRRRRVFNTTIRIRNH